MEQLPKIYCIGANLESYHSLKFLVENGCKINTLITLPSGQNLGVSDYYDLHEYCQQHQIDVVDTTNVNSEETINIISGRKPDYLFTLGWSQIFHERFIQCFSKFIIGTHPAKLPFGRGRAPLPWTVLEDLRSSAVSFFKIDTGVDTGKIIFQREFDIHERMYVQELYDIVAKELASGFYQIYKAIVAGENLPLAEQSSVGITVRGKRVPSDGLIEFHKSVEETERLIRAVSYPYPGAYCYYKDLKIVFWEVESDVDGQHMGTLGQILKKSNNGMLVRFSNGNLWLNQPTNDDGSPLEMKFFRLGDKLGYNVQDEIYKLRKNI